MAMELDAAGHNAAGALQSDTSETLVAEANGKAVGKTPATTTIELDAGNTTVHLPEGTDTSHPVQVGNDLEFIQPDGSIILIPGGAVTGLVIFVGNVEIPADAVAALFSANNIQPAEGPPGQAQNGHGNFTHEPGGIGNAFGLTDLLKPTELNFGGNELPRLYPTNSAPRFVDGSGADISAFAMRSVSEEGLGTGIADTVGNPDTTNDASIVAGTFFVVDPDGDPLTFKLDKPIEDVFSHGQKLHWTGNNSDTLVGLVGNTEIVRISITDGTVADGKGQYSVLLSGPIDHPDPNSEDSFTIHFQVTVSDGKGGTDTAIFGLGIEDDSPTVTVTLAEREGGNSGLLVELDETVGTDRYNTTGGETGVGDTNPNTDDENPLPATPDYLARVTTSINGGLAALFSVGGAFGADGPGNLTDNLSFSGLPLNGTPVATNLAATNGGAISLVYISPTEIDGRDASGLGDTVFKIEIVGGQLQTTLYEAIDHGDDGNLFDANAVLALTGEASPVTLTYSVTRVDYDGDSASDSTSINLITNDGSVFRFDDDGPTLTVTPTENSYALTGLVMELDETVGADRYNTAGGETGAGDTNPNTDDENPLPVTPDYLARVTTSFNDGLASLFTVGGDYGSDLAGTTDGSLSFKGIPVDGTPIATNLKATHGGAISLVYVSPTEIDGKDASGTGDVVFKIEIVGGQLQTTLYEAIDHGKDGNLFDANTVLSLGSETSPIGLTYTVTRIDGDGDSLTESGSINLITSNGSVISFDDDGPTLTVTPSDATEALSGLTMELDETVGTDRYNTAGGETGAGDTNPNTDDENPLPVTPAYLARVTTSFNDGLSSLFTVGGDYGSDLEGSTDGSLSFTGISANSAPIATDLKATHGGAISLVYVSPTEIDGRDASGTGDVVFKIEIVGGQLQTTLYEAIDHGKDGNLFDANAILSLAGETADPIALTYTVTRIDGDGDSLTKSGSINLITSDGSVISFDDDGPTLTVAPDGDTEALSGLRMELDETIGADRYNTAIGEPTTPDTNPNTDDEDPLPATPDYLARVTSAVDGGLASLFTVGGDYGSDLEGSTDGSFSFTGIPVNGTPVATNLSATHGGAISLVYVSPTEIDGRDASGLGDTVFKLEIVGGQLQTTLYEAIDHGADGNLFDSNKALSLFGETAGPVALTYTVTRVDGDGDSITKSSSINLITTDGSAISFDDDGPKLRSGEISPVSGTVDEDALHTSAGDLSNGNADNLRPGEVSINPSSATFTSAAGALAALVDFGSDGKGGFGLAEKPGPVASGVQSKGGDVLVVADGHTLHGYVDVDGIPGFNPLNDREVFTATVATDGSFTFTLHDQIDHPSLDGEESGDNAENYLSSGIDLSGFVVATDGDGDSIGLGEGTFVIQVLDDIPVFEARPAGSTGGGTETETITYTLQAGNADVRGMDGQGNHDILLTGVDQNEDDDSVNTTGTKIGVGDAQSIDGFEVSGNKNDPKLSGPEILTMQFVDNLQITGTQHAPVVNHSGAYAVNSVTFSIDVGEAQQVESAVLFISAHAGGAFDPVTVKINGVITVGTPVYESGVQVGYAFANVPDGASIEVSGTPFDALRVGNYNDYLFDSTAGAGGDTTLTGGNSFKVFGIESTITVTSPSEPEVFPIIHDETVGVDGAASATNPNADDDTGATPPALIADVGAIGYAKSAVSVLGGAHPLFTGSVGADENGTYKFAVTDAQGHALSGVASGLTTLSGHPILLSTNADGVLVGADGANVVFKVYVDTDGYVWIAQYLPIHHDLEGTSAAAFDEVATITADLHVKGTLTDFDHDSVSAISPVALQVSFQDDGPKVTADVDSVVEDGPLSTSGNVTTNDHPGTDGVGAVSWVGDNGSHAINGTYGTLTVGPLGSYTYTLYTAAQNLAAYNAVQGLSVGDQLHEAFDYILADGDGDTAQTSLTININGADDGVTIAGLDGDGSDVTVSETGLPNGLGELANPNPQTDQSEIGTGSFSFTSTDGLDTIKIGTTTLHLADLQGASGTPITIAGGLAFGTLQITGFTGNEQGGTVNYRYTLTSNTEHNIDDVTGSGDQVLASYPVVVTDTDGSSNNASLDVAVNDDGPHANNDGPYTVVEDGAGLPNTPPTSTVSGNVLSNDLAGADQPGSFGGWSDDDTDAIDGLNTYGHLTKGADGTWSYVLDNTLAATQALTVTDHLSFTLHYTIEDSDGDSSPATLTINVDGAADTASVSTAQATGPDATVYEAGLNPNGSDSASSSETTPSIPAQTFAISASDGIKEIVVGGQTFSFAAIQNFATVNGSVNTGEGTLTLTKYVGDSHSGTVTFTYTLTATINNTTYVPTGADTVDSTGFNDNVLLTVNGIGGTSGNDHLVIRSVDDTPIAYNDDGGSPTEGGPKIDVPALTGVLSNDVFGADHSGTVIAVSGGTIGNEFAGSYGKLTLNIDGSYSYLPNASVPSGSIDSFTYTMQDADGDQSQATLSFTFTGDANHATAGETTIVVDEDDLPAGIGDHADGDDTPTAQPATLPHSYGIDGTGHIALVGGTDIVNGVNYTYTVVGDVLTAHDDDHDVDVFTVTLTNNVTGAYTVQLLAPIDHPTPGTEDNLGFAVSYRVYDADDTTGTLGTATVSIDDDMPVAQPDSKNVTEGGTASGNVLTDAGGADNFGADGPAAGGGVVGVRTPGVTNDTTTAATGNLGGTGIAGQYGTLILNADGTYQYHSNANAIDDDATDVFVYTIQDGDGDLSTTTLTINLTDVTISAPADSDVTVYENALDLDKADSDLAPGTVIGSLPGSKAETDDDNQLTATGGAGTLHYALSTGANAVTAGLYGSIQVNDDGTYIYTLTKPYSSNVAGADTVSPAESFEYKVTDGNGNTQTGTIYIAIVDDVPTAYSDTNTVLEGGSTSGNVLTDIGGVDVLGADGGAVGGAVVGVRTPGLGNDTTTAATGNLGGTGIAGQYGTLILNADGTYQYHSTANAIGADATDVFVYTIEDGDGDLSTTTLTIDLTNITLEASNPTETVNEAALDPTADIRPGSLPDDLAGSSVTGSNPTSDAETVAGQLTVAGATIYTLVDPPSGAHGQIQLNTDGSYLYTLTSPVETSPHSDTANTVNGVEVFHYLAQDAHGNSVQGTITIDVIDDVPTAKNYSGGSFAEGSGPHTIDADAQTFLGIVGGADGLVGTLQDIAFINQGATTGTLSINGAGALIYTPPAHVTSATTVTETFKYTVTDQDGDTVTKTVTFDVTDTGITNPSATGELVDEDDIASVVGNSGGPGDDAPVVSGHISYTLGADALDSIALSVTSTGLTKLDGATTVSTLWDASTNTLTGYGTDPSDVVFTIALGAPGATGVDYNVTLFQPVKHPDHDDPGTGPVETAFEDNLGFTVNVLVTDADGSTAPTSFVVTIDDDTPLANNYTGGNFAEGSGPQTISTDAATFLGISAGADGLQGTLQDIAFTNQGTTGGTLTINGSGALIYTPPAHVTSPSTVTETFNYTVTDRDGDSITKVVTFGVTDTGITNPSATDELVDEDDIPSAGGNLNGPGDDAPVSNGHISYTLGADALQSIALSVTSTGMTKLDGTTVSTSWDALTNTLTGYGSGNTSDVVFTIVLGAPGPTGVDYDVTLFQPVKHPGHDDPGTGPLETAFEDNLTFTVDVTIKDADNSQATTSFVVSIDDDTPQANNYTGGNFAEGSGAQTISADAATFLGISAGADGLQGTLQGIAFVNQGTTGGTLSINGSGALIYTPPAHVTSASTITETFNYTVTDKDGDAVTKTVTFGVTDTGITGASATGELVDEDDIPLAGGNSNGPGDDTPVTTGHISYTLGADALQSIALSVVSTGLTKIDGITAVSTIWDAGTKTLTGYGTSTSDVVFTIVLGTATPTGVDYDVTLFQPVKHPGHDDPATTPAVETSFEDNRTFTVDVLIKDADNSQATTSFVVNIDDDTPQANNYTGGNFAEGSGAQTIAANAATFLGISAGADGLQGTLQGIAFVNQGVTGGTLSINGSGALIYTPPAHVTSATTVTETFNYTVTDQDGDAVTKTVTFGVTDTGITNASATGELVDEDDISGGGGNPNGPGDDAPVATGHISYTLGADSLQSIALSVVSTGLTKLDGTTVSTSWDALTNTLTGYGTSTSDVVFTIVLGTPTATRVDYNVTLVQPVKHPGHDDPGTGPVETAFEDNRTFTVDVLIKDADNSQATTSFVVNIDDDSPTLAIVDTPNSVNETQTIDGTWTLAAGADGVGSIDVTVGAFTKPLSLSSSANTVSFGAAEGVTTGILTVGADLAWHFTATTVTSDQLLSFTLKATDGDGDVSSDTQSITIKNVNQALVVSGSISGVVEEEQLPGGNDDTTSASLAPNNDADSGINLNITTNVLTGTFTNSLSFTGNEGPVAYSFATIPVGTQATKVGGGNLTSSTGSVLLAVSGGILVGYVDNGGSGYQAGTDRLVFTLELDQPTTGQYRFTLLDNLDHTNADNVENIIGVNLDNLVQVTDTGDTGDTKPIASFTVNVIDDVPLLGTFVGETIANQTGAISGTFSVSPGADGLDHFNITGPSLTGVTYASATTTTAHGVTTTLTATGDTDGPGGNPPTTLYTLAVSEDGTYVFNLVAPDAATSQTVSFSGFDPGTPVATATSSDGAQFDGILFSGTAPTSFTNPNSGGGSGGDYLKISGNGFGLGSANSVPDNGGFIFHKAGTDSLTFFADLTSNVNTVAITWAAYNGATAPTSASTPLATSSSAISLSADGSVTIDPTMDFDWLVVRVDVTNGNANGGIRVQDFSYTKNFLPSDQNLTFGIAAVDGDGDVSSSSSLGVHVVAQAADGTYTLTGTPNADIVNGGPLADTLTGGLGGDTLIGGAGADKFVIVAGDSTPAIGGSGDNGTITGFDIIKDWGVGGTADKLDFSVNAVQAVSGVVVDGAGDSLLTIGSDTVESHSVNATTGIATFFGTDGGTTALAVTSTASLAAIVQYLMGTDIGNAGATLAFTGMSNTYIYQQTTGSAGGSLVQLSGVTLTNVNTLIGNAVDPIVLDLDHNGYTFSTVQNGVSFDINADGHADKVAWNTSGDGMLAIDLNHDGVIDSGKELFTPDFNGGHFASGSAALASLDTNHDGLIDAGDADYSNLLVWKDANADGVTDTGELTTLAQNGVASLTAPATPTDDIVGGQTVTAAGTVTFTDGSTGGYVEVALDAQLGGDTPLLGGDGAADGLDWDNIVVGTPDAVDTLHGTAGADRFVLTDASAVDFIADYNFEQGDTVDISALLGHNSGVTAENAGDYVRLEGNTLQVDVDGAGAGHEFIDVSVLNQPVADVKVILDDGVDATVNHIG